MNGTIGHLRNVADLVAALNIEAILAEARLSSHESATDLALKVEAGVAALREVAALVEEATAATVATSERRVDGMPVDLIPESPKYIQGSTAWDHLTRLSSGLIRVVTWNPGTLVYTTSDRAPGETFATLIDAVKAAPAPADDAPSFTRRQVSELRDEAAKAGDIETVNACETWLFDSTDEDAAEIIDEALSYARAMQ
jgi:hypothetical protein